MLGKLNNLTFYLNHSLQVLAKYFFNLYKFQMVEDFLGHPVYVAF